MTAMSLGFDIAPRRVTVDLTLRQGRVLYEAQLKAALPAQ
jgi:hypothetical protein